MFFAFCKVFFSTFLIVIFLMLEIQQTHLDLQLSLLQSSLHRVVRWIGERGRHSPNAWRATATRWATTGRRWSQWRIPASATEQAPSVKFRTSSECQRPRNATTLLIRPGLLVCLE